MTGKITLLRKLPTLVALLSALAVLGLSDWAHAQVNVLTNRYDNNRTAANLSETILNTSNLNTTTFGKLGQYAIDGTLYAQPLYVQGLNLGSAGTHNVIYFATMHDVVYAFDADKIAAPLWTHDFRSTTGGITADPNTGDPVDGVPTSVVGDQFGIMSTPVIDLSTNRLYLVTQTLQGGNENFAIHVLDLRTGAELLSQYIYNSGGYLSQRPALALANGQLYIAFASKAPGDYTSPNHGYLLTYQASNLTQTGYFQTTNSSSSGGGIWQSGGGPAIDSAGNVYYLTGNGLGSTAYDGVSNFQESLLKFSYSGGLSLSNWFTASNWAALDGLDLDLSSSSPTLIPVTDLVVFGSKTADVYVLHTGKLGQLTPGDTQLVQKLHVGASPAIVADNPNRVNAMAYWPRATNPQLYAWPTLDKLHSYTFNGSNFVANGTGSLSATGMPGPAFSLSANGSTSGTGILWATLVQFTGYDTVGEQGILYAYNAENVTQELWDSNLLPADAMGGVAKFLPPVVANGKVYVGTSQGSVSVYGLRTAPVWTTCSGEYGYCNLSGSNTVRFGSGTSFYYKSIVGPFACNTYVFGDPLVGVTKRCDYKPETWTTCSQEYNTCVVDGSNTVRFGLASSYVSKSVVGTVSTLACGIATFGTDPLVGAVKQCQYLPQQWATCSQDGGGCALQGPQTVRYGANGVYNVQSFTTSVAPCTATQFGDPSPGVVKTCEILLH